MNSYKILSSAAGSACDAPVKLLGTKIPTSVVTLLIKWTPGEPAILRYLMSQGEEAGAQIRPERL